MSRRVLLVDNDVDALGALASALRARGIRVANAGDAFDAVEQAFQSHPDVVLVDKRLDQEQDLTRAFEVVPELSDTPVLLLVGNTAHHELGPREVSRGDLDLVVSRIVEVSPRDARAPVLHELQGNLEQTPMTDVIQLLNMSRRSGVLSVNTSFGAGEVRLAGGEVVDAVFRQFEGEKAFFRMLGEREGRFAFSPGEPSFARRLTAPTSQLLMEAVRRIDEVGRKRRELSPSGEALRLDEGPELSLPPLSRELAARLQVPRFLDELLDDLPATDLSIFEALASFDAMGCLRRIPVDELNTPFAPSEQLPVLRSLATRLVRPGFAPPPRLVIATSARRLPALAHALRRITGTSAPPQPPPSVSLPRLLGTLRLGDGVEIAVLGLPIDEVFAPTWALALPGTAAVICLDDAEGPALLTHCEAVEVPLIDAESVMGSVDVAVPAQVAALLRSVLEVAAGV